MDPCRLAHARVVEQGGSRPRAPAAAGPERPSAARAARPARRARPGPRSPPQRGSARRRRPPAGRAPRAGCAQPRPRPRHVARRDRPRARGWAQYLVGLAGLPRGRQRAAQQQPCVEAASRLDGRVGEARARAPRRGLPARGPAARSKRTASPAAPDSRRHAASAQHVTAPTRSVRLHSPSAKPALDRLGARARRPRAHHVAIEWVGGIHDPAPAVGPSLGQATLLQRRERVELARIEQIDFQAAPTATSSSVATVGIVQPLEPCAHDLGQPHPRAPARRASARSHRRRRALRGRSRENSWRRNIGLPSVRCQVFVQAAAIERSAQRRRQQAFDNSPRSRSPAAISSQSSSFHKCLQRVRGRFAAPHRDEGKRLAGSDQLMHERRRGWSRRADGRRRRRAAGDAPLPARPGPSEPAPAAPSRPPYPVAGAPRTRRAASTPPPGSRVPTPPRAPAARRARPPRPSTWSCRLPALRRPPLRSSNRRRAARRSRQARDPCPPAANARA